MQMMGLFDHLNEFGHPTSIAGPHAIDFVHDYATFLGVNFPFGLGRGAAAAPQEGYGVRPRQVTHGLLKGLLRSRV
jgi:hypothetical protein